MRLRAAPLLIGGLLIPCVAQAAPNSNVVATGSPEESASQPPPDEDQPPDYGYGFEFGGNAIVGLELDDRVLAGPVTGYGLDAAFRPLKGWSFGGYVQWLNPSVFAETGGSEKERDGLSVGALARWRVLMTKAGELLVIFGAGYRRHVEYSGSSQGGDRLVANGIDFVRAGIGYDFAPLSAVRVGVRYIWSTGCFYDYHRENADGSRLELEDTCKSVLWNANWIGVRAGFAL